MSRHAAKISAIVLTLLFVALIGSLAHSRWTRVHLLPSALRYIPPEANVLVGVGDISSLWEGMDFHFGRVIREKGREGNLAKQFGELGKQTGVRRKADLVCSDGIDINRGVLAGLTLEVGNEDDAIRKAFGRTHWTLVIPVANDPGVIAKYCGAHAPKAPATPAPGADDQPTCPDVPNVKNRPPSEEKLVKFFCVNTGGSAPILLSEQIKAGQYECDVPALVAAHGADPRWIVADHAYKLSGGWLVFPEPDTAILSDSCEFLDRALADQDSNLSYARADDSLFEAVRYQLRRPLMFGPGLLVYVREVAAEFAPVATAAAAINLVPDAVLADVRVRTAGVNARIADQILGAAGGELPWRKFSGEDDVAALVLRDSSLPDYLDFASDNPGFARALGGILEQARKLKHLEQIVVIGTDYRDGLPQFVLGIWGNQAELAQLVFDTQCRLRQSREETILHAALGKYPLSSVEISRSLTSVIESAGLVSESASLGRYRLVRGILESDPLTPRDFSRPDYEEAYRGFRVLYLEPAITEADLRFRLPEAGAEEANILLENRYRLVSTITGNILWVGTGKQQLLRMIDRLGAEHDGKEFRTGIHPDRNGEKLQVLVSITGIIKKGLLSGERKVESFTDSMLLDFRYHRAILLTLKPIADGQQLRLEFAALGPAAAIPGRGAASAPGGAADE